MLRVFWAVLGLVAGALLSVGLGAFDFTATVRATEASPASPARLEIAPASAALTFARMDGRTFAVTAYDAGRVRGVALDALLAPGEDAIGLVNRLGYGAVLAEIERAATIVEVDASDLDIPVDLGPLVLREPLDRPLYGRFSAFPIAENSDPQAPLTRVHQHSTAHCIGHRDTIELILLGRLQHPFFEHCPSLPRIFDKLPFRMATRKTNVGGAMPPGDFPDSLRSLCIACTTR